MEVPERGLAADVTSEPHLSLLLLANLAPVGGSELQDSAKNASTTGFDLAWLGSANFLALLWRLVGQVLAIAWAALAPMLSLRTLLSKPGRRNEEEILAALEVFEEVPDEVSSEVPA